MKATNNLSISSPPPRNKKDLLSLHHHHHPGNGEQKQKQQQRLYIAPQSTIRAPPPPSDAETTTAITTQQIDTNARRRRGTNNMSYHSSNNHNNNMHHNSSDFGGGNGFITSTTTTYSPCQSSPSERSNTQSNNNGRTYYGGASASASASVGAKKKKKLPYSTHNRRLGTSFHYHDSDNASSSNSDDSSDDDEDDDDEEDSILDNIHAPCLWMDDMEGGNVTMQPLPILPPGTSTTATIPARESSRHRHQRKHPSKSKGKRTKTNQQHHFNSSSGSIKSESKYSCNRYDTNNDGDDRSVHTYHTSHSLQQQQQQQPSNLVVDFGTASATTTTMMMTTMMTPGCETRKMGTAGTRAGSKKFLVHQQQQQQQQQQRQWNFGNNTGRTGMHSMKGNSSDHRKNRCLRSILLLIQGMVGLLFIYILYDSHRRNTLHRQQLLLLDEERAHILEQMTWIDAAAKKVHKKYGTTGTDATNGIQLLPPLQIDDTKAHSSGSIDVQQQQYKEDNKMLQSRIDMLQLRVQQNARTRTSIQFGDEPVQVSLPISEGDVMNEHYVIALSDDAPHAVNTFLQQVTIGIWNEIDFQQIQDGRIIQASTRYSDTKPILEFIEQSRGCHTAGSVALHQLESDEFHVMVLKIHMDASAKVDPGDVCIGNVVKGFEFLEQILPQLPKIQSVQ